MTDLEAFNALSACFDSLQKRVVALEAARDKQAFDETALKSQDASWCAEIERTVRKNEFRIEDLEGRLVKLEAPRDQQALQTTLKSQAAQHQAQEPAQSYGRLQQQAQGVSMLSSLHPPLRSDTKPLIDLAAFARRLLNPDDLGHAVTKEVRDSARRALGMPEVREYDL